MSVRLKQSEMLGAYVYLGNRRLCREYEEVLGLD